MGLRRAQVLTLRPARVLMGCPDACAHARPQLRGDFERAPHVALLVESKSAILFGWGRFQPASCVSSLGRVAKVCLIEQLCCSHSFSACALSFSVLSFSIPTNVCLGEKKYMPMFPRFQRMCVSALPMFPKDVRQDTAIPCDKTLPYRMESRKSCI